MFNILHIVVNTIAGGRSGVRVLVVLGFLTVFGILFWIRNKKQSVPQEDKSKHFVGKAIFFLVSFLFCFGLIGQLYLFSGYHISPWDDFAVFVNNREITSTTATHNHFFKAPFGLAGNLLGVDLEENLDYGAGLLPFIPTELVVLASILLLALFLLQIYSAWVYFPTNQSGVYKVVWGIVFTIIQFTLIKTIIDGGILSEKVFIWIVAEYCLLKPPAQVFSVIKRFFISWSATMGLSLVLFLNETLPLWQLLRRLFIESGLHLIVAVVFIYFLRKRLERIHILILIFGAICLIPSVLDDGYIFEYRNRVITSDTPAIIATYSPDSRFKDLFTVGDLSYQTVGVTTTIGRVADEQGILDNLEPISIPWVTCLPLSQPHIISYRFGTNDEPRFTATSTGFYSMKISSIESNIYRSDVVIYNPCTPRPLNLINELMLSAGIAKWYMWNIEEPVHNFSTENL